MNGLINLIDTFEAFLVMSAISLAALAYIVVG